VGLFRKSEPAVGQLWLCADPRGWSGGVGGAHVVVLLAQVALDRWRVAVIETRPRGQVLEFEDPRSGVRGGIRLNPRGRDDVIGRSQLIRLRGKVGGIVAAKLDEALGQALLERDQQT